MQLQEGNSLRLDKRFGRPVTPELRLRLGLRLGPCQKKACVIESYFITFYTSDIITLYF